MSHAQNTPLNLGLDHYESLPESLSQEDKEQQTFAHILENCGGFSVIYKTILEHLEGLETDEQQREFVEYLDFVETYFSDQEQYPAMISYVKMRLEESRFKDCRVAEVLEIKEHGFDPVFAKLRGYLTGAATYAEQDEFTRYLLFLHDYFGEDEMFPFLLDYIEGHGQREEFILRTEIVDGVIDFVEARIAEESEDGRFHRGDFTIPQSVIDDIEAGKGPYPDFIFKIFPRVRVHSRGESYERSGGREGWTAYTHHAGIFARTPYMRHVRKLDVSDHEMIDEEVAHILNSPYTGALEELDVGQNNGAVEILGVVAECPQMSSLKVLNASASSWGDAIFDHNQESLEKFSTSEHMRSVEALKLNAIRRWSPETIDILLGEKSTLESIKALNFTHCSLSDNELRAIADSSRCSQIEFLSLSFHTINTISFTRDKKAELDGIVGCPTPEQLLDIHGDTRRSIITDHGVSYLVSHPNAASLKVLDLSSCEAITDRTLEAIANSPYMESLEVLRITSNRFCTTEGMWKILTSPYLKNLKVLDSGYTNLHKNFEEYFSTDEFPENLNLESLDLSGQRLTRHELLDLMSTLLWQTPTDIKLYSTGLTDETFALLIESPHSKHVKKLEVGGNSELTFASIQKLAETPLPNLQKVVVGGGLYRNDGISEKDLEKAYKLLKDSPNLPALRKLNYREL